MMWQERQNAVLSERCISFCMPATRENSGRKKSTPNARIFPARVTVIAGRTTRTPASTALKRTRITMAMVGIELRKSACQSLLQGADVRDEILDLLWFQTFAISGHFAFAAADDSGEHIVTLPLHIGGTEIPDLVRFANGGFSFPVSAVTARAFCFVESVPAGLRLRRQRQNTKRPGKQKPQGSLAHTFHVSIHISS